ncbi:hypothetical protein [Knoellia sp. Soil729]|uniref:hypothetical protein n=1 Tax=Knoellia sp. Soil729 TaxID=1736394 RepID=UPI0007002E22|nr:hypothetical protein [Knoellia sp. Soil729]KRE43816.1 hypothetical protein ASG74_02960 [Knoellia sp. Soil729]
MAAAAVAFVVNILMARLLGPAARGEVAWILQGAYVVAPLLALGVDRESLRGLTSHSAVSQLHVWVVVPPVAIAGFLLGGWRIAALVVLAGIGASLGIERGHAMASGRFQRYMGLQLSVQAWTLTGAVILYVTEVSSVDAWLLIYLTPAPLLFGLWLVSIWRGRPVASPARPSRIAISTASLSHVPGTLGAIIASRGERLLLPVLASNSALGLYVVVATASESLIWFTQGISDSRVAGLVSTRPTRRQIAKSAARDFVVFVCLSLVLALLIALLLVPALGPGFTQARHLVIPVCISAALWATYRQVIATWIARQSAASTSRLEIVGAVLVLLASALLIPAWGALGAAFACITAYGLMIVIAILTMRVSETDHV